MCHDTQVENRCPNQIIGPLGEISIIPILEMKKLRLREVQGQPPNSKMCAPISAGLAQMPPLPPPTGGSHAPDATLPQGRVARAQGGRWADGKTEYCACACVAGQWLDLMRGGALWRDPRAPRCSADCPGSVPQGQLPPGALSRPHGSRFLALVPRPPYRTGGSALRRSPGRRAELE